ncbi:SLBB domain-containing protein [Poseidonibacter lekithochrous]|uniref:SLBB domain-containing protein n=1 Tax=Poseidonibacter lekithochrous TaxID=1904463 RepID=UPI0008FC7C1A|nr:SLBB domain-containing protein [Poseidonibacter lekithochrous]QKJ22248.1 putative polysaccharide export protein [Poseidonibacter lekithochrous]
MRVIYSLLLICSLAFSATLTPSQMQLAKSAGFSDADIKKGLNKNSKKESIDIGKKQVVRNDVKKITETKKNIEEGTRIKRYGSLFFNNKNKLDPYSVPTPNNYNINYGDKLSLKIYGAKNESFELEVDKNGNINIPQVSELKIIGLQYKDIQKLVMDEVKKAYPNSTNILLNISEFTSIQVTITGLVNAPGLYNLSSFSTIKDALITSGGILKNGSYRNIYLKRAGKTYKTFDLYSLIRYGNTNIDTVLKSGDVILVKPINKEIKLTGEVNYNALFELKNGENFRDLLNFAAGFNPKANKNAIKLKRYENNSIEVYTLSKDELYKYTPKSGDEIHIYPTSELSAKLVKIVGNVIVPSEKSIPGDNKLSTLLKNELKQFGKNGYFLNDTNYEFAVVKNDNNLQGFNIDNVLNKKEDIDLKIGDVITIFKNSEFKEKPYVYANGEVVNDKKRKYDFSDGMTISNLFDMVGFNSEIIEKDSNFRTTLNVDKSKVQITRYENNSKTTFLVNTNTNKNFKLKKYDEVKFFDFSKVNDEMKVSIKGEVFIPGSYNINENTTINDIVNISGGLTKKALMARFEISRYYTEGNERKRKVLALDMNKALNLKIKIFEDDEITIFPIANWNEKMYVELKGLVRYPGKYAIEQGEKLSSVILRAGGFLQNSFVEGAVFTREEIRLLQEKRLEESLDRLNDQIVKSSADAQGLGEEKDGAVKKLQAVKQLEKQAKANRPIGRVSLNLYYDLNRFMNSTYDLVLKDKDILYIPSINDTVSVVGEVLNQNTFVYDSELDTDDYLSKAGGITDLAHEEYIYIVKANGETQKYESNYFWGNDKKMFKGDTIVVPMQFDSMSDIKFAKDVSQILYQFAITAASLKTVGGI